VAYANQHFAAGIPGWKTDRGKIYIMYGPPNSIEAHPVGAAQPYELWHYREIKEFGPSEQEQGIPNDKTKVVTRKDVDMKFVDACRCGEFQLQPGPKLMTLLQQTRHKGTSTSSLHSDAHFLRLAGWRSDRRGLSLDKSPRNGHCVSANVAFIAVFA
jgi:hypothetical protein